MYTLMMIAINNPGNFQTNTIVQEIHTWNKLQLHRPAVYLTCIQKGVFYSYTKVFNNLLPHYSKIKE
jgi:hypothetical protein